MSVIEKTRRKRISEAFRAEHKRPVWGWWWLSFADPNKPAGEQFLGVAIVWERGITHALRKTHLLRLNPGGSVSFVRMPDDNLPPTQYLERLLDKDLLKEAGLV